MLHRFVKIPTGEELAAVIDGFEMKWGFPQCAGEVDRTHIPIVALSDCPTDYYNKKGFHSIIMQATADYWYCFTDIYVGCPGQVHDGRVFSNSLLFEKGQAGNVFPHKLRRMHGVEVPILILGDPVYPLLPYG